LSSCHVAGELYLRLPSQRLSLLRAGHSHNPETIKSGLETGEMQRASVTWGNKGLEGKEMSLALLSLALSLCCLRFFL